MLVDSSVWIASARKGTRESKVLKDLLLDNAKQISTCKLIQLEVSQGARSSGQFTVLWEGFESLLMLDLDAIHWKASALNFFKCKKKGLSVSTVDCIIGTLAQQYSVPLWSLDKIFTKMAPILGIEVLSRVD